jgi:hypothetical protein
VVDASGNDAVEIVEEVTKATKVEGVKGDIDVELLIFLFANLSLFFSMMYVMLLLLNTRYPTNCTRPPPLQAATQAAS